MYTMNNNILSTKLTVRVFILYALINIMLPSQGTHEFLSYPLLDTWYWLFHTVDT